MAASSRSKSAPAGLGSSRSAKSRAAGSCAQRPRRREQSRCESCAANHVAISRCRHPHAVESRTAESCSAESHTASRAIASRVAESRYTFGSCDCTVRFMNDSSLVCRTAAAGVTLAS